MSRELDRLKLQQYYSYNNPKEDEISVSKLIRNPYDSELSFFKQNPTVGGMATEDNMIILNPYSSLKDEEKKSVAINEFVRIKLRKNPELAESLPITEQQRKIYKQYSNANDTDIKHTVLGRIFSGDPSANATPEQIKYAEQIKPLLKIKW